MTPIKIWKTTFDTSSIVWLVLTTQLHGGHPYTCGKHTWHTVAQLTCPNNVTWQRTLIDMWIPHLTFRPPFDLPKQRNLTNNIQWHLKNNIFDTPSLVWLALKTQIHRGHHWPVEYYIWHIVACLTCPYNANSEDTIDLWNTAFDTPSTVSFALTTHLY